jgi:uncharacterized protein YidB (DUF937 family)
MGFLDVLNGMANGPRGHVDPNSKGGMSPITMAILALLAYKGYKHITGGQRQGAPQQLPNNTNPSGGGGLGDILGGMLNGPRGASGAPASRDPRGANVAPGGGPGDWLRGGLGGLLAGGAAGSILSGGLGSLLEQFRQHGQGETANSWVSRGPNEDISESDLAKSIGADDIDALTRHTGLSRDELLSGLSRELPEAIDEMTPDGRLPTAEEASHWV